MVPEFGYLFLGDTETGFSFITVDAAALFSKWVGESEKALRQVFLRAKQASRKGGK